MQRLRNSAEVEGDSRSLVRDYVEPFAIIQCVPSTSVQQMGAAVWILHPCLQLQAWTAEMWAWLDMPCHCVPGAFMVKDVISTRTRCSRRTQHWHAYDLCGRGLCVGGGGSAVDTACDRMAVTCPCVDTSTRNMSSTGVGVAHTLASAVGMTSIGAGMAPGSGRDWQWACLAVGVSGSGLAGAHLPDTRFLAVHHRHVAGLAIFDELLLGLIELLGHEAHEGVVWGVSYSPAAKGEEGVIKHPSRRTLDMPLPGVSTEQVGRAPMGGLAWTRECHRALSRESPGPLGSPVCLQMA